jgi:hypothetical protein
MRLRDWITGFSRLRKKGERLRAAPVRLNSGNSTTWSVNARHALGIDAGPQEPIFLILKIL